MCKVAIFFINSLQNGGAERVVQNQAIELKNRGIKTYIYTIHDKIYYEIPSEITVKSLHHNVNGISKLLSLPKIAKKLDAELDKIVGNNEVVLMTAHLPFAHNVLKFSKYSKEFLYVMHNPQFRFFGSNTRLFKLKFDFFYKNRKIIAVSDGIKQELLENYNCMEQNVIRIYNPIDYKKIDDFLLKKTDLPIIESPFVLFAGRLTNEKNVTRLLEAYMEGGKVQKYKLVILGTGPLEENIKEYIRKHNMENNILLLGWEKNVFCWMKKAKLLICSSDYESFGMSIVEALYCNCPVVSTNCKYGPAEILIGELKKYLSDLNSKDLNKVINEAIDCYPSNLQKYTTNFEISKIINEYLDVYRGIKNG